MFIVANGTFQDGFIFYGSFGTVELAEKWIEENEENLVRDNSEAKAEILRLNSFNRFEL